MGYIIDMSKFQKDSLIDWATFSRNVDLLFARIQYGSSLPDIEYKNHAANAKKYNIPFHSYVFPCFVSVNDARVEARDAVSRQDSVSLSICVDVEPEQDTKGNPIGISKLPQQIRLDGIVAYVDELRKQGVKKVGGYIDQRVYESWGINTILNIFDYIWIPSYGTDNGQPNKTPRYACDIWQYTSKGKVPGYGGNLDLSALNGNNKTLEYFTARQTLVQAKIDSQPTPVSSIPVQPKPVMRVKALVKSDIRNAPSHTAGYVRDAVVGEEFDVYQVINKDGTQWHLIGGDPVHGEFWIDGNNGHNLSWINNPTLKQQPSTPQSVLHKVISGDTVGKLAKQFGSTIDQIKSWNKLDNNCTIFVGKVIRVK